MTGGERTRQVWVLSLLIYLLPVSVSAQSLFESNEPIDVQLEGPFRALLDNKASREELPFVLHANGKPLDIGIRLRGKSRVGVCDFPPLRLNFRAGEVAGTVFAGQDKLKLVTHCMNHDRGESDLLQEFVVYRVLNEITDASYRVRLLRMNYMDPDHALGEKASHRYAFVIESAPEFAARISAERYRTKFVNRRTLDLDYAALIFVFEYLVANTDWSLVLAEGADKCCHNIDLYMGFNGVLLVPYDMDLTGVVNARYAFPDKSLRIKRVTQRQYRGMCMDRSILVAALQQVKALEDTILAIPGEVPGIAAKDVKVTRDHLARFFEEAADEAKLLQRFERDCIEPRYRRLE